MKAVYILVAVTTAGWCQTAGTRGHSATAHGPAQWPGYLGVGVVEVTPERARTLKLAEAAGVEVSESTKTAPPPRQA